MSLLKAVLRAFDRIAPPSLAESWDNTGLLIESPMARRSATNVLLTIDLTPAVAAEALSEDSKVGVIVAYHPIIFRGLKSLTAADPLQEVMLKCAAAGISIYSPHTSLDSVVGGINDHLCGIVAGTQPGEPSPIYTVGGDLVSGPQLSGIGVGAGRRIQFEPHRQVNLMEIVHRCKTGLNLQHVQLARSRVGPTIIRSVGVCAGSGASICESLGNSCDVFLTGEMSHHELLRANARGVHIILASHSNTERFFLGSVLRARLKELLLEEGTAPATVAGSDQWDVLVSCEDSDPVVIV
ncbi:hypothetical protein CROQUDRAFT_54877 [Cronartium quercuum f. sp. fusiforme G11]|uniref:Uncharacterized protein n=1 Tax=Cronartium quercuum f. sp. fusiforme G11 TaxID=708437 RepID=A0A9P6N8D3_9BASI|nr:hypothetical protein CROQUDRAFT_54877 [Cronartium quercuum f. sp. fusiforme G11]